MGRLKKYHTDEERIIAKRERWKRWYEKNRESINEKRMKGYYERKSTEGLS
jgi:hypothetical protein